MDASAEIEPHTRCGASTAVVVVVGYPLWCNACELVWHTRGKAVVAVCGVVRVSAIARVFQAGTCLHYRGTTAVVPIYVTTEFLQVSRHGHSVVCARRRWTEKKTRYLAG